LPNCGRILRVSTRAVAVPLQARDCQQAVHAPRARHAVWRGREGPHRAHHADDPPRVNQPRRRLLLLPFKPLPPLWPLPLSAALGAGSISFAICSTPTAPPPAAMGPSAAVGRLPPTPPLPSLFGAARACHPCRSHCFTKFSLPFLALNFQSLLLTVREPPLPMWSVGCPLWDWRTGAARGEAAARTASEVSARGGAREPPTRASAAGVIPSPARPSGLRAFWTATL